MLNNRTDFVLLLEVADVLKDHALTRCRLTAEYERGELKVSIAVPTDAGLDVTELGHQLAYLAGLGAVRAFATQYDIDTEQLDRLLVRPPQKEEHGSETQRPHD